MQYLPVDLGGRPGVDCRGYCEFCYFRRVKHVEPLGCRHCHSFRVGCTYCTRKIWAYTGFKHPWLAAIPAVAQLLRGDRKKNGLRISGGGDSSCYPRLHDLFEILGGLDVPIKIDYTSGKGFDDPGTGRFLVEHGLTEIDFSVFSVDPELRSRYLHIPRSHRSLSILEYLCNTIDVYAGVVVLPGVNDGDDLIRTCEWLEEQGARGLILMRFGNTEEQGLILGNAPVIRGQRVHGNTEFRDLVVELSGKFRMKINGGPLMDVTCDSPFAIRNRPDLIGRLPPLLKRATVITGSIAAPFIRQVLDACGSQSEVIATGKEIACLITLKDLRDLDLSRLEKTVILPGRALLRDQDARKVLSADGIRRTVIRGPDLLTVDADTSLGMSCDEVYHQEVAGFTDLIGLINRHGV
jgi:methanogenesis marker radical SAM protein